MTELFSAPIEQSLLCSFMDFADVGDYVEQLNVNDFYYGKHQIIFQYIKEQHLKGESHASVIIWDRIRTNSADATQVSESYMIELASNLGVPTLIPTHIKKLKEFSTRRKIQDLGKHISTIANDTLSYTGETAIEKVQSLASSLDNTAVEQSTLSVKS